MPAAASQNEDTSPLLISGNLISAAGGAEVELKLWTKQDLLDALPEGGQTQLLTLERKGVATDGVFDFRLNPSDVPSDYISAAGQIDVVLAASSGGRFQSTVFSATAPAGAAAWEVHDPNIAENSLLMDMLVGAIPAAPDATEWSTDVDAVETTFEVRPPDTTIDMSSETDDVRPAATLDRKCGVTSAGNVHGPHQVKLADAYGVAYRPVHVIHGLSSDVSHTMGVAFRASGSSSWKAEGTLTKSTALEWISGPLRDRRTYTQWYYRYYSVSCMGTYSRPYRYFDRGQTTYLSPHPSFGYCGGRYEAGAQWTRKQGKAATFSTGVSMHGISLVSQSGFTTGTALRFVFNRRGRICGNNSYGSLAPKVASYAS